MRAYLLEVAEPYKTPYEYNTRPFSIANEQFNHGFTYYNLGKQNIVRFHLVLVALENCIVMIMNPGQ